MRFRVVSPRVGEFLGLHLLVMRDARAVKREGEKKDNFFACALPRAVDRKREGLKWRGRVKRRCEGDRV